MAYQQRKYKLTNLYNNNSIVLDGTGTNNEPRNWDNSDYTIKRSTTSFSTEKIASDQLEFTGGGAAFLRNQYLAFDVEANVVMQEFRVNPETNAFESYDIGQFDFNTFEDTGNIVKVNFDSTSLAKLIKSKQSNKLELTRDTSINGEAITPLKINQFAVIDRAIFLDSVLNTSDVDKDNYNFRMAFASDWRYGFLSIPLTIQYESDTSVDSVPRGVFEVIGGEFPFFPVGDMTLEPLDNNRSQYLYYNANVDKKLNVSIELSGELFLINNDDLEFGHLSLRLVKASGGDNPVMQIPALTASDLNTGNRFPEYDFMSTLAQLNDVITLPNNTTPRPINVTFNQEIELKKGESLGIMLFGGGNFEELVGNANLDVNLTGLTCKVQIQENSRNPEIPRRSQFVFNNDAGSRLMEIITGKTNKYKSEFFNNGDFKFSGITSGKWIRGFFDSKITTSLKDFLGNCKSNWNMGYNVETIDGEEVLVHEELKHFFQDGTVVKLPRQVSKVKRTAASPVIFNTVKVGYKKPEGDNLYEEVNGLNEFNVTNEYILPIQTVTNEYNIESPYRADSEGKELTARKHQRFFPTQDYRTDNNIFNLDLKNVGTNVYEERTWFDDFEQAPKNVFDPNTATGLRLTPYENMARSFWFLKSAFYKNYFFDKSIRYASTRGNSNLITKKAGESEIAQNQDTPVNSIENPRFVSQWIEFEYKPTFDILKLLNGKTNVNGREVPNTYFKIEFINEFNEKETGYLFELKPNKEGKWKLLKAF